MGIFAVRTLKVAEIHYGDRGIRGAARRSIYTALYFFLVSGKRMHAEWHNLSVNGMLAVRGHVQFERLLTLSTAEDYINFRQPFYFRRLDTRDFPAQRRIVSEPLVEKSVDCFLGR